MSLRASTVRNATDTGADSRYPAKNFVNSTYYWLKSGSAYIYIYFGRPFPLGSHITSATLHMETWDAWGITPTLTVRRITSKFAANAVTWNNKPSAGGATATASHNSNANRDVWEWDVTAHMQEVSNGAAWYGFRIETDSATWKAFLSAQAGAGKPYLKVVWSEDPAKPTTLIPSGAHAVSTAKPVLQFNFTDHAGSTSIAACQVQINGTNDFTLPAFDSGEVAVSSPQLDLATTSYAGIAEGGTAYWRVRVKDGTGNWSPYSDAAEFTRTGKGTVTITSPDSTGKVYDPSPTISWTFTGGTQQAWQVLITRSGDVQVWNSGKKVGTETSTTAPRSIGLKDNTTYTVTVRVWDDQARVQTVGDPIYAQATKSMAVDFNATTADITGLTATALYPRPAMDLQWTWAGAAGTPDSFAIRRNGTFLDKELTPSETLVSGTTYHFVDAEARPMSTHTWYVHTVINGKLSPGVPITASLQGRGLWLTSIDDSSLYLFIAGTGNSTWAMGEEAETFTPLGGAHAVRVTAGVRGYEGSVEGQLINEGGKTVAQWVDIAYQMRALPGQIYRMQIGSESFRVVIGNLSVNPTGHTTPGVRPITFDFWQTSSLTYEPEGL